MLSLNDCGRALIYFTDSLLISPCTSNKKIKMRGHNSAYNAGVFGREMGCKAVALNHFGSASSGKEFVSSMVSEAREGNQNASQLIATFDFFEENGRKKNYTILIIV